MRTKLRIGSRASKLAIMQTKIIMDEIQLRHPELELELITMHTTGDMILDRTLDSMEGKGLFVKELEMALLTGQVDIVVHSLKDVPMKVDDELPIICYAKRGDPRDVLVLPTGEISEEKAFLNVGSSSRRRTLQLKRLYQNAETKMIRGNVLTRLDKLDRGEYSALILAAAGLKRLGLEERISRYFSTEEIIPAAGQGILAIQARKDFNVELLDGIDDEATRYAALAERSFVHTLDGGCSSPVAAYCKVMGSMCEITGLYYDELTGQEQIGKINGSVHMVEELGKELACRLKGAC